MAKYIEIPESQVPSGDPCKMVIDRSIGPTPRYYRLAEASR